MSIDPTVTAGQPTAPLVAAVVSASDPALLRRCLDAIGRQVYEVAQIVVVGGDDEVRHVAGEFEATWRPTLRGGVSSIGTEFTFVWALRERAIPEEQALRVLVQDATRVGASVAGSKIRDADEPSILVSVGTATDAFGAPYHGLQPGELDQSQYDVIRDVGAVSGVSALIRRDLYMGLGGIDPSMAPAAAATDLCQRARLRGGRVVVVPGSVVYFDGDDDSSDWRERAGEIRAMLKSYSPLTLAWCLPLAGLIGLVESIGRIPFGRFPLPGVIGAWLWNLIRLPSALRQRVQVRRGREAGDEELFRYQVSGSSRLRQLWDDILLRVRDRFPEGVLSSFAEAVEAGQQRVRQPAFFVAAAVILFSLVATREIWTQHLPIGGFALLPPESGLDTLRSYAGGWNPAGLGSPETLRPEIGAVALIQILALGSGGLAVSLITVASFLAGTFGLGRLLRVWGIESTAGYLAGTTLMAGPAMIAATGATHWSVIPAVAAIPWAVHAAFSGAPDRSRRRAVVVCGLATGVAAVFQPIVVLVPVVAVLAWAAVGAGRRMTPLTIGGLGAVMALPLLVPWVIYLDIGDYLSAGDSAFWDPGWLTVAVVGVAAVAVLVSADRVIATVAGWGATMAAFGALVSRTGDLGAGREVFLGGLILNALGVAVVVGCALEAGFRRSTVGGWRWFGSSVAGIAAVGAIVGTLALAGPGRAGLPEDSFSNQFDFAAPEGVEPMRVLLFGDQDELPGTSRIIDGLGYRVFIPPHPTSWDAYLGTERLGDIALHSAIQDLIDGRTRRGGAALAEFGIGWVAFTEPSALETVFESQLDLVALRSLDFPVFRNEASAAIASNAAGDVWTADGTGFAAPPGAGSDPVYVAANADFRWGPGEWTQVDWANEVSTSASNIGFAPYLPRRLAAVLALLWLIGMVAFVARVDRGEGS